jgi:2-keto-4-pentenoate hydratase/2-oxohepta-3-ene-1,7-dioic acid hydratase in catechol pathway
MQASNTKDMIFPVSTIVSTLSQDMTIPQGTVILTGTPSGVGYTRSPPVYLKPGDCVMASIETIGTLSNPVDD